MNDIFAQDPANERDAILNKWKDKPIEELLKAKVDADLYVRTLERQKDEMRDDLLKTREELLAKAKFEELIDRFENAPRDLQVAPPKANEESQKFDLKDIESLFDTRLKQAKVFELETANMTLVQNKLQERFGEKSVDVLKEQQSTLGLSDDDVRMLAKKSPEAFFRMMGLNDQRQTESFQTPPKSAQRNDNFSPRGATKRDYAYYQELKKTQPKLYLDPKIAVQMHNDVMEMGESAFYGQN